MKLFYQGLNPSRSDTADLMPAADGPVPRFPEKNIETQAGVTPAACEISDRAIPLHPRKNRTVFTTGKPIPTIVWKFSSVKKLTVIVYYPPKVEFVLVGWRIEQFWPVSL